ncbi:hybrid sensor histidine kinase/response regulator [Ideonella alba]|uniref:Chemotaxis protein CheA n=1 Tax=Ideonella alba TaxID=2824118 RepID=A0A941BKU0_9BURK|nr:Hpt domain-containing protein [Ideonella alba]MBQ0930484.1 Hpt domain-containing protein [Ideonella alba]
MHDPALTPDTPPADGDLTALAWVLDELRRSLDTTHKALRRLLRDQDLRGGSQGEGLVATPALQQARSLVHQGCGVLSMIGQPVAATCLSASEQLLQRLGTEGSALRADQVAALERLSFALLDYLGRRLNGQEVSSLALFPVYRTVMGMAGAERIHPADLWQAPAAESLAGLAADAAPLLADDPRVGAAIEGSLLPAMRGQVDAQARLSRIFAGMASGAPDASHAVLWRLASAFYEAQAWRLLNPDVHVQRLGSRLLSQLRASAKGADIVPQRLLQDLSFFCARARSGGPEAAPRLNAVRQQLALPALDRVDYDDSPLGRFDPALVPQARRRFAAFKDIWAVAASGDDGVLPACSEQVALVAESVRQLYPGGDALARALVDAVQHCAGAQKAPGAELSMEMATALLCLDASLDDLGQADLGGRIQRLSQRLQGLLSGQGAEPIEPWMEALYREVSDRQTMGSVVQELRAALAEVEQQLDRYHRHPQERELLIPVPAQLATMRGVLGVLGLGPASQAVQRMRQDVDQLLAGDDTGDAAARLADNLGVMSFLIDLLGVQPQLARTLFRFDADTGRFSAVMGRSHASTAPAAAAAEPALRERAQALAGDLDQQAISPADLAHRLELLSHHAVAAEDPALAQATAQAREALQQAESAEAARADVAQALQSLRDEAPAAPVSAPAAAAVDDDEDMRSVFFEEADEVVAQARDALQALAQRPADLEAMTTVRRAFHTLKGSSRMVQLPAFGEAAWACERLYNTRLAQAEAAVDAELRQFTTEALDTFRDWTGALRALGHDGPHDGRALIARADALRAQAPMGLGDEPALAPSAPEPAAGPDLAPQTLPEPPAEPLAEVADPAPETGAVELAALAELPKDLEVVEPAPPLDGFDLPTEPMPLPELPPMPGLDLDLDLTLDLDLGETAEAASAPPASEPEPDAAAAAPEAAAASEAAPVDFELDLDALDGSPAPAPSAPVLTLVHDASRSGPAPAPEPDPDAFKQVGALRVPIALFNIYLNEADEQSRRLSTDLAEWQHELERPVSDTAVALAHSLAGNSATVGYHELSALARRLEHQLEHAQQRGQGHPAEALLFLDVAEEIRRLLHQFAAGFLKPVPAELLARLDAHEQQAGAQRLHPEPEAQDAAPSAAMGFEDTALGTVQYTPLTPTRPAEPPSPPAAASSLAHAPALSVSDVDAVDALDEELFEIFVDEARELLPRLAEQVRQWDAEPHEPGRGIAAMRSLHTLKGGARLAGAMRLGEMAHRLETAVEPLTARGAPDAAAFAQLHASVDALAEELQRLLDRPAVDTASRPMALDEAASRPMPLEPVAAPAPQVSEQPPETLQPVAQAEPAEPAAPATSALAAAPAATQAPVWGEDQPRIDWSAFAQPVDPPAWAVLADAAPAGQAQVRVRAGLLDRLVSHAGEVGTARARIDAEVGQMRGQLRELTDNLERLRRQLRDLDLQAETQMTSRMEAARQSNQAFDPLEMDRFTRVQELTRMLTESVGDVGTVQRGLQQSLQTAEDQLAAQSRMTRELQDDLLRARMVEFDTVSDRLYRVVRQAAKETGKQVRLDLSGGSAELDRSVLDRMTPAFEHLLRNAVVHGIEPPGLREATGKSATGAIEVAVRPSGNEVRIEVRDDGAGLDLARIAERARAAGLLGAEDRPTETELAQLIFRPGFTTADEVTELAGRGIGMDVVRSEVTAMGGRVETSSATGQGTSFRLILPLTTAVTQVVPLDVGGQVVAVPSILVEQVRRITLAELEAAYTSGVLAHNGRDLPFFWLGGLLQLAERGQVEGRTAQVLVIRSAAQRVVVHVREVQGNQEVVVKNLGPQLARLPGLAGMSLLPNGQTVLIYNPVALAAVYGEQARARLTQASTAVPQHSPVADAQTEPSAPLVLVVDDSLTVRRVTQRLLLREGYRVALARDGLEALEMLAAERPALMLSDIEMPRMDGFDLVRNVRGEPRWADLPVIMITSRIAQKHRDHARELGVDHYLGKPYDEDTLLALVRQSVLAPA